MKINKNIFCYVVGAVVFVALKIWFRSATTNELYFLLKPISKIVELLSGTHSHFTQENGFHFPQLNVVIDKSCSGFNFGLLCFLLALHLIIKHNLPRFYLWLPTALLGAFFITIFVNASRIFASIIIERQTKTTFPNLQQSIHLSIGIIINCSFLVIFYFIAEKLFTKKQHHANLI